MSCLYVIQKHRWSRHKSKLQIPYEVLFHVLELSILIEKLILNFENLSTIKKLQAILYLKLNQNFFPRAPTFRA